MEKHELIYTTNLTSHFKYVENINNCGTKAVGLNGIQT